MNAVESLPPDWTEVNLVLENQDGLISRNQAMVLGVRPHDLARLLRRRVWVRVHEGVFVDHTGGLSWRQRAWAGILHFSPAALSHRSALRAVHGPGWRGCRDSDPIEIAVAADRNLVPVDGYRLVRTRGLEERALWNASPPRLRYEDAAIDVAAEASTDLAAVGVLADACQSRRTTARRLLGGLDARSRIRRRRWLVGVLMDVAEGTCSVLEHAHLTRVERAHGLPQGTRQDRTEVDARPMYRDVLYEEQGLVVELDGRLFHDSAGQRDVDMERDLDAAVQRLDSVRLGWGQCTDRACRTAGKLGLILRARGWEGSPHRCGPDCSL